MEASSLESLRRESQSASQSKAPVSSNFEVSLALKMEDVLNNSKGPFQSSFSHDFMKL